MTAVTKEFLEQLEAELQHAGLDGQIQVTAVCGPDGGVIFAAAGTTVTMSPGDLSRCEGLDVTEEMQDGKRVRVTRGGTELAEITRRFLLARESGIGANPV